MNISEVKSLLQHPEEISGIQTRNLQEFIAEYPYFQAARALQLKGLYNQQSFLYNSQLKVTAAYTSDRSLLFDFINSSYFYRKQTLKAATVLNEAVKPTVESTNEETLQTTTEEPQEASEEILNIGKPLDFNNERHSFSEWLQLAKAKPIQREPAKEPEPVTEKPVSKSNKFDLIDKFLEKTPKIVPSREHTNNSNLAKQHTSASSQLMTETLARVYLEQKKYKDAIQAYEILILKYPEKSGLFADQINAIKKLQQNN